MLCKEFEILTPKERTEYIGQLLHACMNDSGCFQIGEGIIKTGELKGLFIGVQINPAPPIPDNETNTNHL